MDYPPPSSSPARSSSILALRSVTKYYGRRCVLRVPAFDIVAQDSIVISGDNGSGKSTFLRLLAGVTKESSGSVSRAPALAQARVVFVTQTRGISPDITVAQHLRTCLQLYGRPAPEDVAELPYASTLGLEDYLDSRVHTLSTGYQKLVALAGALGVDPHAIYLDEPLSGLDTSHGEVVLELVNQLADRILLLAVTAHAFDDFPKFTRRVRFVQGTLQEPA